MEESDENQRTTELCFLQKCFNYHKNISKLCPTLLIGLCGHSCICPKQSIGIGTACPPSNKVAAIPDVANAGAAIKLLLKAFQFLREHSWRLFYCSYTALKGFTQSIVVDSILVHFYKLLRVMLRCLIVVYYNSLCKTSSKMLFLYFSKSKNILKFSIFFKCLNRTYYLNTAIIGHTFFLRN